MNSAQRPALGKGVRLRQEDDGSSMLLVPEGALLLNPSAAAALSLVNGERTIDEIAAEIVARFDVTQEEARDDVAALFNRLFERRLLVVS